MALQRAIRYIVLGCLFIIPFLVLFVSDSLFFPFISGKGFAFRILVEIALAGWVLLALAQVKYRPKFSWTLALYGALVIWMAIADALAVSPYKAFWSNFERMDGWVTLVHVFAFFVVLSAMLSADQLWRKWWLTFAASSALVSLYGFMQLIGAFQIHQGGVRLDATLGNSEYLAAYLLFAIAIALWQGIASTGWLRYALFVLSAGSTIILFFTATRGAILGFVGALALGAVLWMIEAGTHGRRNAAIALAALIVIVGGFVMLRHSSFVTHDPTLSRLASISLSEGSTRFSIWGMAVKGAAARPVTGWGQEGFNYIFNEYYSPDLYAQEPWFDRAHNIFLDWLTQGGAPAFILFLALLISAIVAFYREGVSRTERVMLLSVLAAYAFQGLFVFDNLFTYIPLAALLGLAHMASARPIKAVESAPVVDAESLQNIATPVVTVIAIALIWVVNVPSIAAAHDLIVALSPSSNPAQNLALFKKTYADHSFGDQEITEQLVTYEANVVGATGVSDDTKSAIVAYAIQQISNQAKGRPLDARILLEASLAYRAAGDLPDALKEANAAIALSPNKQASYFEAGTIAWQLGDTTTAKADFDKAYALDMSNTDAASYAAAGRIFTGDIPGGKELLSSTFGTTTVDSDILVYAYYGAKDYADIVSILEYRWRTVPSADAGFRLATAYALAGRTADARAAALETMKQYPEAQAEGQQLLSQIGS